jgi:hypothetical protein
MSNENLDQIKAEELNEADLDSVAGGLISIASRKTPVPEDGRSLTGQPIPDDGRTIKGPVPDDGKLSIG